MPREFFIALLAAAFIGAIVWVGRTSVSAKWFGPFPGETELRSSYYWRKALFALRCLVVVVLVAAAVWVVVLAVPGFGGSQALLLLNLLLALFGGMAILGAMLAALASLKAAVLGPNPVLRTQWEQARLESEPKA